MHERWPARVQFDSRTHRGGCTASSPLFDSRTHRGGCTASSPFFPPLQLLLLTESFSHTRSAVRTYIELSTGLGAPLHSTVQVQQQSGNSLLYSIHTVAHHSSLCGKRAQLTAPMTSMCARQIANTERAHEKPPFNTTKVCRPRRQNLTLHATQSAVAANSALMVNQPVYLTDQTPTTSPLTRHRV
jgi:hypothetical protein